MKHKGSTVTLLMAEDDPDDRVMVEEAWQESLLSDDLHFVEDGEELMHYLKHQGKYAYGVDAPRPSLILMDLNMPKKDGREALKEIKSDPDLRQIPVVVLTTSRAEEDIARSYEMGANSFITKPVTFDALVDVLKTLRKYWLEIVALPS